MFNATEFGPICIQPADQKIWDGVQLRNELKHKMEMKKRKLSKYNISEDCLTLNIYVELNHNGQVSCFAREFLYYPKNLENIIYP